MVPFDIPVIAAELNNRSDSHRIGRLQDIRKELKGFTRRPGSGIFSKQTIQEDWAFHHGGRAELQFNIGKDGSADSIRYGVAFSFETSQTLPSIDILKPKVRLLGEFLTLYPDEFADMRMWHWEGRRSDEYMPGPVVPQLVRNGVFLFLGKHKSAEQLNYEDILDVFDRLLPLYEYVESGGKTQPVLMPTTKGFSFVAGCPEKMPATKATYADRQLDVALRHNELQQSLYQKLSAEFGPENVGAEVASGAGTWIDLVVRHDEGYSFFEIKTAYSPRACIREALGQILEYSFWPGSQEAIRLVIVGESPLNKSAEDYIHRLRQKFSLPVEYLQVSVPSDD